MRLLLWTMLPQFNSFQQVFLVAYSILYGIMLQNISRLKPSKARLKVGEANISFQPFPWQQARKRHVERARLVSSIVIFNVLPFLYAIAILRLLQDFGNGLEQWQFWALIFVTFWSGLGVFGFQRLYGLLAWEKPRYFMELRLLMEEQLGEIGFDRIASVLSICLYILPPLFLLSFLNMNPYGLLGSECTFLVFIGWSIN